MWRIDIDGEAVYSPDVGISAGNPVLTQELNAADQLTFEVTPAHRLYDAIRAGVLTSRYIVYRDGSPVSYGRILAVETQPLNAVAKVTCEGELAYLNDAVLPEYDFGGSPSDYMRMFVIQYNAQTGDNLKLGRVTIADANDYIVRGNEKPTALLPELLDKTVNSTAGGVLRISHKDGNRYLDWLAEPDTSGSQPIAKGSNLLDLSSLQDGASIVTAIMPIGAQSEDGTYVRIPSSKDGTVSGDVKRKGAYLYTAKGVQKYGWHAQVMQWEDVTEPKNLRSKAIAAVQSLSFGSTITAGAVDLTDAGYNVDAIALGQSILVECDDISASLFVTGCEFHMDYPADSTYTFGKLAELTANVATPDSAGWSDPTIYANGGTIMGDLTVSGKVLATNSVRFGYGSATRPMGGISADSGSDYLWLLDADGNGIHQWRFNSSTHNIATRDYVNGAWTNWSTPNMLGGSQSVTPVANGLATKAVAFGRTFSTTPTVVATLATSNSAAVQNLRVAVSGVSTTGFNLQVYNSGTSTTARDVNWFAVVSA